MINLSQLTHILYFSTSDFFVMIIMLEKKTPSDKSSDICYETKLIIYHQQMFCKFYVNPYKIESFLINNITIRSKWFFDTY